MTTTEPAVPRIAAPHDPDALDDAVLNRGAAVVEGAFSADTVRVFLDQIDAYARTHPQEFEYADNSMLGYFQGDSTDTLHSLIAAIPAAREMVLQPAILGCARRLLKPLSDAILLSGCEYMSRAPGTARQDLHRDTISWPHLPARPEPIALTVLGAMTPFTAENGATWVVLDSHGGPPVGGASAEEYAAAVQAELEPGDALIVRSDALHGGGANTAAHGHRRLFSTLYQVGWLRPIENPFLSTPPAVAATFDPELQDLLGYTTELVLGLYKGGDPRHALPAVDAR